MNRAPPAISRLIHSGISLASLAAVIRLTMLRLKPGQRRVLIERVPELANFVVGSLFFGQFLIDRPFSLGMALASMAFWLAALGFTFWLVAGEEQ